MKKVILCLIFVNMVSVAYAAKDPGSALMENFGSACRTNGGFSEATLDDARALMNTLEQLKNDPDCQNVSGAISKLGNLENRLNSLNSTYEYQLEIAKLEAQEVELMSQISSQTDPGIISDLEGVLRGIQLDKAGYISMDGAYSNYNGGEIQNIYAQIVSASSSAYSAIASNQLCIGKYGGVLSSAASLSSSIAASASNINPAFGYGMAAVSDFIGNTVNFFRDRGFNNSIRRVANGSTVMQGLKCAMETLTNRWCEIQDAEDFLEFEASFDPSSTENDELVNITKLYDRDIPVFLNWLEKVKAGAPAANSADAGRRSRVIFRQATVQVYTERGGGWFTEGRQLFELAQSSDAKYAEIRKIINSILNEIGPGNPLVDIHPVNYIPYYLLGLNKIPTRAGQIIDFASFDPRTDWPSGTYIPDFNLMVSLYNTWIAQAQRLVTQELNQVLQPDPLQVLSIYDERTSNIWKIAPSTALGNILKFIQENKPEKTNDSSFKELYETTISKLVNINDAVIGNIPMNLAGCEEDPEIPETREIPPVQTGTQGEQARLITIEEVLARLDGTTTKTCDRLKRALEIIFQEAQLEFGPIVFKNRLETIIRVAIDEYIQDSDPSSGGNLARLLAADSYLDVLSLISGTDNRGLIREDIINAKKISLNNMMNFSDTFGFYINTLFRNEQNLINEDTDDVISNSTKSYRARMCFLLASLPKWPRKVSKSYCVGYQLKPQNNLGPKSEVLTLDLMNKGFKKRSCMYHDYLEASKVYQDWGIILEPKS